MSFDFEKINVSGIAQALVTDQKSPESSSDAITAQITRCRDGQPLVVLPGRPFNGMEIRPHELERMADRLTAIARLAKQHKGKAPTTVVMG